MRFWRDSARTSGADRGSPSFRAVAIAAAVTLAIGASALAALLLKDNEHDQAGGRCTAADAVTSAAQSQLAAAKWSSGFETGSISSGEWSWWGEGDPTYVGISIVDPTAERPCVPPNEGKRIARFEVTSGDVAAKRINSKLYEYFHQGSGDRMTWRPTDVSGTYRTWFYLPADYSVPAGTSVTAFQFKDQFWDDRSTGAERSEPTWFVSFRNAPEFGVDAPRSDAPAAVVQHWRDWEIDRGVHPGQRVLVPLGRWFEMRAEIDQGKRIDFFIDGKPIGSGLDSHYPVGNFHKDAFNWIFGIGHYAAVPGVLYADAASFTPAR